MKQTYPYQLQKTQRLPKINLIILLTGLLLLQASFSFAQWTRKANALRKRGECPSVLYNGKIYVFGGFGEHPNFEDENEVYDPALNKWSLIASFPSGKEISHQSVVLIDNEIWHIGGRSVDADGPVSSQVIIYDITTNTWKNGPELKDPATGKSLPLGAGGAALLGRTLHVFGGFGPTICIDQDKYHLTLDIDKYKADPFNTKWENNRAPMPVKRNHLNTVTLGGKIYAIGGQFIHCGGGKDQKYVHSYDPIADKWTRLTDLPEPRSHSEGATFTVDGKIYTAGGQGATGTGTTKVFVLNPSGNNGLGSWSTATQYNLPNPYYGISAKVIGSKFIISHGALSKIENERYETYSASITRNTPNVFGFVAKCFSKAATTNQKITLKNLLYTIEGSKSYSLSSSASWLKITKNATGVAIPSGVDIGATIDATGLSKGSYSATITAKGTGTGTTFNSASFCVNLTVDGGGTTGQQVVSFTLINADTDNAIQTIEDGSTITLSNLPTQNLNIRANTSPSVVGSVKFVLDGPQALTKTENSAPYALFEETDGDYKSWTPSTGSYTLSATPYSGDDGGGTAGPSLSISFNVKSSTSTTQPLVTNITSSTGRSYTLSEIRTGVTVYTDRTYQATTIPSYLNGELLIKTPNDDKRNTSTSVLSFRLSQDATVYVGYDPRATSLPSWLSNWQKLSDDIGLDDPNINHLDLYSKSFPAGTVSLGGNLASPASGASNNYIVVVKAQQSLSASRSGSMIHVREQAKIQEEKQNLKLQVYPNPSLEDKVQVRLESPAGQEAIGIILYDALGRMIQSKTLLTDTNGIGSTEIYVKGINRGFYIIEAQSISGTQQIRLLVE
ncbi:MAG: T9SS type A sorting domain-containing protein [Bacteroidota bacterium]|nr:T9SS type A sorting domain-containing protein [Bacteroidota bacterium]